MVGSELVIVTGQHSDDARRRITEAAAGSPVEFVGAVADRPDLLPRAAVVAGPINDRELTLAPNLRWVHSWAAGVDLSF